MAKIKRYIVALLVCFTHYFDASGQYYFFNDHYYESLFVVETGVAGGAMNCLTDLGGRKGAGRGFVKDINWSATQLCGSLHAGVYYSRLVGARVELAYGEVTASDSVLKYDRSIARARYIRNLSFRSNITEVLLLAEYHPPVLDPDGALSPYFITGIGWFSFNPQARINNAWIDLVSLHTEGQGFSEYPGHKPYKLKQQNLPVGFGIQYEPSAIFTVRFEMLYRKLWTDYLDDVSTTYIDAATFDRHLPAPIAALAKKLADRQSEVDPSHKSKDGEIRGNDKNNDAYFSFNLRIGLTLGRRKR